MQNQSAQFGTYRIGANYKRIVDARIERYNRLAIKEGMRGLQAKTIGEGVHHHTATRSGNPIPMKYFDLEVEGHIPSLNGFTPVAMIDHFEPDRSWSRGPSIAQWLAKGPWCEHCEKPRERRWSVLLEKDGVIRQVGRVCLKEYTGCSDPDAFCNWLESLTNFLQAPETVDWCQSELEATHFTATTFLAHVAAYARTQPEFYRAPCLNGRWYLPIDGNQISTIAVRNIEKIRKERRWTHVELQPTDEDKATAEQILQWVRESLAPASFATDFDRNLVALCQDDHFDKKHVATIAVAFFMFQSADSLEARRNEHLAHLQRLQQERIERDKLWEEQRLQRKKQRETAEAERKQQLIEAEQRRLKAKTAQAEAATARFAQLASRIGRLEPVRGRTSVPGYGIATIDGLVTMPVSWRQIREGKPTLLRLFELTEAVILECDPEKQQIRFGYDKPEIERARQLERLEELKATGASVPFKFEWIHERNVPHLFLIVDGVATKRIRVEPYDQSSRRIWFQGKGAETYQVAVSEVDFARATVKVVRLQKPAALEHTADDPFKALATKFAAQHARR